MKKIISILLVATLVVASVFAASATAGMNLGWDRVATDDAFAIDFAGSYTFYKNDDFTAQAYSEIGFNIPAKGNDFKMTAFVAPSMTFSDVIFKDVDLVISAGCKMVFVDGFDAGIGADVHTNYWLSDGMAATLGGKISRLFDSNVNEYGAYLGMTAKF